MIVLGFAAWSLRKRGVALRVASEQERDDIAQPLARILSRHADLSMLSPDLYDVAECAAATAGYVQSGPIRLVRNETPPPQQLPDGTEPL